MRELVGTMDGWRATVRTVRWSPVLATPVVCAVALLVAGAVTEAMPAAVSLIGEPGLVFTAVSAAFVADDTALSAVPGAPVEAPIRRAARAAVVVPVVVVGWLLVLAVFASVAPPTAPTDVADRALVAAGLGISASGFAALGGRCRSVMSPGGVGVGVFAILGMGSLAVPHGWLAALPPPQLLWPAAMVFGLGSVALATREPGP